MSFNAIRENKILAKVSESTVINNVTQSTQNSNKVELNLSDRRSPAAPALLN